MPSGCSSARLECTVRDREVASSNLATPTTLSFCMDRPESAIAIALWAATSGVINFGLRKPESLWWLRAATSFVLGWLAVGLVSLATDFSNATRVGITTSVLGPGLIYLDHRLKPVLDRRLARLKPAPVQSPQRPFPVRWRYVTLSQGLLGAVIAGVAFPFLPYSLWMRLMFVLLAVAAGVGSGVIAWVFGRAQLQQAGMRW